MTWRIHHKAETESTNLDARAGRHGDVFTADFQSAGRGRLDHKWLSPKGANLMMSAVLSVGGLDPELVATLPLVAGLAVAQALKMILSSPAVSLKWPNDVLVGGKKIAGILCERRGDEVIVGIGVNVNQTAFPPEIAGRATSLAIALGAAARGHGVEIVRVRDLVLEELGRLYACWRREGFAAVHPGIAAIDFLKGREVSVRQTDGDSAPVTGVSNGIMPDGALDVGGIRIYAGEAHVEKL